MCGVLSRGLKGSRNYVIRWERSKCFVIGSAEDFNIYKNNEEKKAIAPLILRTCHNVFPTSQLHGFPGSEFFKIFLDIFPLMVQSHVLALAAIAQKRKQSKLFLIPVWSCTSMWCTALCWRMWPCLCRRYELTL